MTALNQTAVEMGYSNYKDLITCASVLDSQVSECVLNNQQFVKDVNAVFESRFNIAQKISWYKINSNNLSYLTYNGGKKLGYANIYGMDRDSFFYFLNDGTVVTPIAFYKHSKAEIDISFDTNGPHKGPNRWGYDIFTFTTAWNKLCAKEKSQTGYGVDSDYNGRGCYDYALKDVNPDDKTKGYWESLYR